MFLTSKRIPVPHGFGTRDDAEVPGGAFTVHQVHGDRVVKAPVTTGTKADAVWTDAPKSSVAVKTADCVPILLVDPRLKRVAAVHSGWRGTDARIAQRAVEALQREGSQ